MKHFQKHLSLCEPHLLHNWTIGCNDYKIWENIWLGIFFFYVLVIRHLNERLLREKTNVNKYSSSLTLILYFSVSLLLLGFRIPIRYSFSYDLAYISVRTDTFNHFYQMVSIKNMDIFRTPLEDANSYWSTYMAPSSTSSLKKISINSSCKITKHKIYRK